MEKLKEENARSQAGKRLEKKIDFVQQRLSGWLNWKCRQLSGKALLALLIAFSAIWSSYLFWLIILAVK